MRQFKLLFIVLLTLLAFNTQAADPRPGLWNLSVTMTADGAAQPFGPYHRSQCFTQEDMQNPEKLLADIGAPDCSYGNQKNQDNRYSFTLQCGGDLPMNGSGSVTYGTDTFQGEVDIVASLEGLEIATRSQISGVRAGDCEK